MIRLKKSRIIVIGLISIIGLFFLGTILVNKTRNSSYDHLDKIDQNMFQQLSSIYTGFENSSDKLWNSNYRLDKKPLILIRVSQDNSFNWAYAYAVNVEGMGNWMTAKEIKMPDSLHLPKIYRIAKFDPSFIKLNFVGNFQTRQINGGKTFLLKYHPDLVKSKSIGYNFSTFLIHESFHAFKQEHWLYDQNGDSIQNFPYDLENLALIHLELKLLDKAIYGQDANVATETLKEWAIIRTYRYYKWPQLKDEQKAEAIEGTATYMEHVYNNFITSAVSEPDTKNNFDQMFRNIVKTPNPDSRFSEQTPLERSIRYYTGAVLGLIMDKMKINWKDQIEDSSKTRGKAQYEILKHYYGIEDSDNLKSQVEKIKSKYNYEESVKLGEELINNIKNKN